MAKYVGIDLGTTFSVSAYIDESGRPTIIEPDDNRRDDNLTPSCVGKYEEEIIVGEKPRREWGQNDWGNEVQNAAARFKRHMGTSTTHQIGGKDFTPTELSAAVLKKIKDDAEKKIGPIAEAVVTIPANFLHEAREATINAARMAGLNIKYIINEPTAAALYYAYQADGNLDLTGTYVVFDLGGGTFDVSVIKLKGQDVEVIASEGLHKLGGMDFDECLWKLIANKYKDDVGTELPKEDFPINDAEKEKKSLSNKKRTTADIGRELIDVSRLEFEECVSTHMAQIEMTCENVLDKAGVQADEITSVFLAGGSTRMPCVIECARKVFKQDPISTVNVDEVVALGACLYAAYKSDGAHLSAIQKKSVSKMNLAEVAPYYLGTRAVGVSESKGEYLANSILIEKNKKIPYSFTRSYYTRYDGQEAIECTVTVSAVPDTDIKFSKIIEKKKLKLPRNRPAGQELEITYSIDENGMFHGHFKDVSSGEKISIKLSMTEIDEPPQSKIDKFLVE